MARRRVRTMSRRQQKAAMANIGRKYTSTRPILPSKYQDKLDKTSNALGFVPEPTAQKAFFALKVMSKAGGSIKIQETTVPVKGYRKKDGTYVESHRRTIKKKIKI